jgi:uncharacterized membrane protein
MLQYSCNQFEYLAPQMNFVRIAWIGRINSMVIIDVQGYQGEMYKLPIAGVVAEKQIR